MSGSGVGVLLIGGEERAVLATTQALRRAGYRIGCCAARSVAPALWSRICDERLVTPDPRDGAERFVSALEPIAASGHYSVLLPGADAALLAASALRRRLEPHLRLGLPDHATVERCLDKVELRAAAVELSWEPLALCEKAESLLPTAEALGFPVVLKAQRSVRLAPDGRFVQSMAKVVSVERELQAAAEEVGLPLFLEHYQERPAIVSCAGVVAEGKLLASAASRYQRTWPPIAGSASLSEPVDAPPGLTERVEGLVAALCWQGIFELELFDIDGEGPQAVDLNPRPYGSLALAVAAGAKLPAIWCDRLLGRQRPVGLAVAAEFRCGVCYKQETYNLLTRTELRLRERPLVVMESSFLNDTKLLENRIKERLIQLTRVCLFIDGVITVSWHNNTLMTRKERRIYEYFVNLATTTEEKQR